MVFYDVTDDMKFEEFAIFGCRTNRKNHIYLQLCIYSSYLNLTPIGDMVIETIQVGVKHFKNLIKKKQNSVS